MKMTQRARRAAVAVVAAVAIGGSGVAVGAATAAPAPAAVSAPATSAPATSAPAISDAAAAAGGARASYADVVRQVLPSVVLISTTEGLGSGVVLDHSGDIVTNAHVAGDATTFQVQVPGDPAPRTAELVGHLRRLVPAHLIPRTFRVVARFPLTPNGKIDRRALRAGEVAP